MSRGRWQDMDPSDLYRSLDGASLGALVPNAGPLRCPGHWTLVLEQALELVSHLRSHLSHLDRL